MFFFTGSLSIVNSLSPGWVVVAHAFNPTTGEVEADRFLQVPGQPVLHIESIHRK